MNQTDTVTIYKMYDQFEICGKQSGRADCERREQHR
jgi:hypothetical protein